MGTHFDNMSSSQLVYSSRRVHAIKYANPIVLLSLMIGYMMWWRCNDDNASRLKDTVAADDDNEELLHAVHTSS